MSFILEALKKSENERQRTVGPSLADVPISMPREQKPWWAFAVGALLLVNLFVLLFVLISLRGKDDPQPTAAAAAPTEQPAPATTPSQTQPPPTTQRVIEPAPVTPAPQTARSQTPARNPAVRSLAEEADVDYPAEYPALAAAARVPEGPPIVRPIETPDRAPSVIRPGASSSAAAAATEPAEVLPTLQDLAAGGTHLPDLHLDIHVHSPVPAERFVFVNMRKYVEGQTLAEGPSVERITADGVVLNHRGMRFLLPRQ